MEANNIKDLRGPRLGAARATEWVVATKRITLSDYMHSQFGSGIRVKDTRKQIGAILGADYGAYAKPAHLGIYRRFRLMVYTLSF